MWSCAKCRYRISSNDVFVPLFIILISNVIFHLLVAVVNPKGKGEMQTYWLELTSRDSSSVQDGTSSSGGSEAGNEVFGDYAQAMSGMFDAKTIRLIEWNADVLLRLLKQIVARRRACPLKASESVPPDEKQFAS